MHRLRHLALQLVAETLAKWSRDNGWLYAAACAAFAALALAPMLLIALRLAELFGNPHDVRAALLRAAAGAAHDLGYADARARDAAADGVLFVLAGLLTCAAMTLLAAVLLASVFYAAAALFRWLPGAELSR